MGGWIPDGDVESRDEDETEETEQPEEPEVEPEEVEEEPEAETPVEQFRLAVADGTPKDVTISQLSEFYKELDDVELLEKALEHDDRSSATEMYERQLEAINGDGEVEEVEEVDEEPEEEVEDEEPIDEEDEPDEVAEEVEEVEEAEDDDTERESVDGDTEDDSGVTAIDTGDIAPGAISVGQASELPHQWKIEVWGPPGLFKTHFCFTMPEPVVLIDTEGKAHDIAHKFEDKAIHIFQPDNYQQASKALDGAIEILDQYREEQNVIGTIAVDSMSIMWELAQQFYVERWYPDDDRPLDEIREDFKSAMQSGGAGDWKQIKKYHNTEFRDVMVQAPYHICWSAMSTEDYSAVMEEGLDHTPMKPAGEKNNVYKVDSIIRGRWDENGHKVGDLEKSGLTNHQYKGLLNPTFKKHKRLVEALSEWEADDEVPDVVEIDDHDTVITQGVSSRG